MELDLISATLKWDGFRKCIDSWDYPLRFYDNAESGQSLMESYQAAFEQSDADIIGYVHDDLVCHDLTWRDRVMKEFSDPLVGLVGFAGALGHGDSQMYQKPYELSQLGRVGFLSNMKDAERHGRRFSGSCDVTVLDGMAIFVRRKLLTRTMGWPLGTPVGYIAYDYWISCVCRLYGYRIRLVGCAVDHLGGKSTGLNPNLGDANFAAAHRYIYDHFELVLPARVEGPR